MFVQDKKLKMINDNLKLAGQTALVTGANSGIGKGVALALGKAGANVMVNYVIKPEAAEAVVQEINSTGGKAICFKADVSSETEVKEMFAAICNQYGTIDILINNAGIQKDSAFTEMSLANFQKVLEVNLIGQFLCAREAAKEFIRRGPVPERSVATGKIICMSSVHQTIPWAGHVNYATSKGGIMMMMESIAQELAPQKIRVNSIAPGAIQTPINTSAWNTEDAKQNLLKLIPYGRIGEPQDIGKLAVWLASDDSDYITGATIFIDGGMTLYPGFRTGG